MIHSVHVVEFLEQPSFNQMKLYYKNYASVTITNKLLYTLNRCCINSTRFKLCLFMWMLENKEILSFSSLILNNVPHDETLFSLQ